MTRTKRLKREKYAANADAVKAKAKDYRKKNPEKIREMRKAYLGKQGDRIRAATREYYRNNTERLKEYAKEYRQKNPEVVRQANRRNRALRRGAKTEPYTAELIVSIYGDFCHLCSEKIDLKAPRSPGASGWEWSLHLDHVVPLAKGGSDLIENIRPSHAICNLRKARARASCPDPF